MSRPAFIAGSSGSDLMQKQYCVYILANQRHGTLYTGCTSNLPERIYQHRSGVIKGFTNEHKTYKLVYYEIHEDPESMIRREKLIKKWKRQWKINQIEKFNPEWDDLAESLANNF